MSWTFLRAFLSAPAKVGAVLPSGKALARRMVDAAEIQPHHVVVELGAGTGPFTARISEEHPEASFLALEPNAGLAGVLRERFPGVRIDERYAQELPQILDDWGKDRVDRVVSGLPWTVWPEEVQDAILEVVCANMKADGRLVTFTYVHAQVLPGARRLRAKLESRFHSVQRTRVAWTNLPPAFVWVCSGPRDIPTASA